MGWAQIVSGSLLVVVLLLVGGYFLRSQWRLLRVLAVDARLPLDDLIHQRRQAWRRLVAGVLILLLAVMLTGALVYLEDPAQRLADKRDALPDPENPPPWTGEDRDFARLYGWYWLVFLVLLLALVVVGAWDYLALRQFGMQQRKRIQTARRAMISSEAKRLRAERALDQEEDA